MRVASRTGISNSYRAVQCRRDRPPVGRLCRMTTGTYTLQRHTFRGGRTRPAAIAAPAAAHVWATTGPQATNDSNRSRVATLPAAPLLLRASGVTRSANPARLNRDRDRHERDDEVVPQRAVIDNVDDEQRECGENHYPVRPRVADAVRTDHSAAIREVGPCFRLLGVAHAAASIARAHPRGQRGTATRPPTRLEGGP